MPRRTKLVPPRMQPESQALKTLEESDPPEQKDLAELDHEIECPRCNDVMELGASFDALAYSCENCSFFLKCV